MNKSKIFIGITAAATLIVCYLYATPYILLYQLKTAAENKDGQALSIYVEFPALRENIKNQMDAVFTKKLAKKIEEDQFAGAAVSYEAAIMDKIVDSYVTPDSITRLMDEEKLNLNLEENDRSGKLFSKSSANTSTSYQSFNKFSVVIRNEDFIKDVKLILTRQGFSWKLTDVELPL